MNPELKDVLVVLAGIAVILGIAFGASRLSAKNIIKEDILQMICDMVELISSVSLTAEDSKNAAQAIVGVVEFVQSTMAKAPIVEQKDKAVEMLKDLAVVVKLTQLSDDDLHRIVNMAFVLIKL